MDMMSRAGTRNLFIIMGLKLTMNIVFSAVAEGKEFLALSCAELCPLLASDRLRQASQLSYCFWGHLVLSELPCFSHVPYPR